jgi:hypothetical protein
MMGNKSRKTKTRICGGGGGMWAQGCSKDMAVVRAESVVAVVMMVTRTRNSKDLDLKPTLDMTMQTRIQQSKY